MKPALLQVRAGYQILHYACGFVQNDREDVLYQILRWPLRMTTVRRRKEEME